jgi:tetratricopeptide (TPR) repeat protein
MVKLKLLLLLPYFGVIFYSGAQDIAPMSQKDSVDFLVTLAEKNYRVDPKHAEALCERAHRYAVEVNYIKGQAKALYVSGAIFNSLNRTQESSDVYLEAARLFESIKDSTRAGRAYNQLASIFIYKLNNYTKAYQYCTVSVSFLQNDSVHLQSALANLAALYMQTGKIDKALELYKNGYEVYRKKNDLPAMCTALNNIATAYDCKREFKASIAYYQKALKISKALSDFQQTTHILLGLAPACCNETHDHNKAVEMLREAVTLSVTHSLYDKHIYALQSLAAEWEHLKKMDNARRLCLEALQLSDRNGLSYLKGNIYKQLSHIYQQQGLPDQALKYHQQYAHFTDSTAQQERLAVAGLNFSANPKRYLYSEKIAEAKSNIATTSSGNWIIFTSLAILIPGGFFIFYKKRKEKEAVQHHQSIVVSRQAVNTLIKDEQKKEGDSQLQAVPSVHLEVVNGEGIKLLPLDAIWWFQKEGKTYQAFTENGNYRVRQNISEIEQTLPPKQFFRINRAVIINTSQMNNYSFWENHKYIIRMKDSKKTEFIISRNRLREMKEAFQVLEGS